MGVLNQIGCLAVLLGLAVVLIYAVSRGLFRLNVKVDAKVRKSAAARGLPVRGRVPPEPVQDPAADEKETSPLTQQTAATDEPKPMQPERLPEGKGADTGAYAGAGGGEPLPDMAGPAPDDGGDLEKRLRDMDKPILDDGVSIEELLKNMDRPPE